MSLTAPTPGKFFLEKPHTGFRTFYLIWVSLGLAGSVIGSILSVVGFYIIAGTNSTDKTTPSLNSEYIKSILNNPESVMLIFSVLVTFISIVSAIAMIVCINKINADIRSENRVEWLSKYYLVNIVYSFLPLAVSVINVLVSGYSNDLERYVTYFSIIIGAAITTTVFMFSLRDIKSIKDYNLQFDPEASNSLQSLV